MCDSNRDTSKSEFQLPEGNYLIFSDSFAQPPVSTLILTSCLSPLCLRSFGLSGIATVLPGARDRSCSKDVTDLAGTANRYALGRQRTLSRESFLCFKDLYGGKREKLHGHPLYIGWIYQSY